jgi:phosphate/sulfate permease
MAIALYYLISKFILQAENRVRRACQFLPFFYSIVVGINCYTILHTMNKIYQWGSNSCFETVENITVGTPIEASFCFLAWHFAAISLLMASIVFMLIQFLYVPRIKRKIDGLHDGVQVQSCSSLEKLVARIERKLGLVMDEPVKSTNNSNDIVISDNDEKVMLGTHNFVNESPEEEVDDCKKDGSETPEMRMCFQELQAFSASFDAFAHGGNDVGNSIGPVMALWAVASTCKEYGMDNCDIHQSSPPQSWIILYGAVGIILGLWLLGKRVIQTVGRDIASITPARGFSIDIMAGFTVLFGSMLQIPLSTTHCKVGAVFAVSLIHDRSQVSSETFKKIAMAWFVTLPVSGAISALAYYLLTTFALQ